MTARSFTDVEYNYQLINERIAEAAQKIGKAREDITFLAATKTVDAATINHAISLGLDHIGENRVQELLAKYEEYDLENCSLQFIGHTDLLVEVNIGREENKSGVFEENLEELLCQIAELDGISVQGLMTIPPICDNKQKISHYFNKMHRLFIDISQKKLDNINMHILSMGMSDDYYEAILEGATMVRIGSALFGARNYT